MKKVTSMGPRARARGNDSFMSNRNLWGRERALAETRPASSTAPGCPRNLWGRERALAETHSLGRLHNDDGYELMGPRARARGNRSQIEGLSFQRAATLFSSEHAEPTRLCTARDTYNSGKHLESEHLSTSERMPRFSNHHVARVT